MVVDKQNNIWNCHSLGISRIDPITNKIETFTEADGFIGPPSENSALAMQDGSLIFGGKSLNRISPSKIQKDSFIPAIYITDFKLHNKDVLINGLIRFHTRIFM